MRYTKKDNLNTFKNEYLRLGSPIASVKMTKERAWELSETELLKSVDIVKRIDRGESVDGSASTQRCILRAIRGVSAAFGQVL